MLSDIEELSYKYHRPRSTLFELIYYYPSKSYLVDIYGLKSLRLAKKKQLSILGEKMNHYVQYLIKNKDTCVVSIERSCNHLCYTIYVNEYIPAYHIKLSRIT